MCDQAQKFITAYAAFLKRQGKLPIPGELKPFVYVKKKTFDLLTSNRLG